MLLQGDALGDTLGIGGSLVHALGVCDGDALGASEGEVLGGGSCLCDRRTHGVPARRILGRGLPHPALAHCLRDRCVVVLEGDTSSEHCLRVRLALYLFSSA
jgi:hypothetical protein